MKSLVLDSFAMVAYLENENGAKKITEYLDKARKKNIVLTMSRINWGEVFYIISRERGQKIAEDTLLVIEQLPVEIMEITKDLVYEAARLKAQYPVAYADCFAAALAKYKQCPILTGDREFEYLKNEIQVEWL